MAAIPAAKAVEPIKKEKSKTFQVRTLQKFMLLLCPQLNVIQKKVAGKISKEKRMFYLIFQIIYKKFMIYFVFTNFSIRLFSPFI